MTDVLHLLGADRLARPERPLSEGIAGKRDPSPTWDPWYSLSLPVRRQLLPWMAPAGDTRALTLDQVAALIGAGDLDHAMHLWAHACHRARHGAAADALSASDVAEWQAADAQAEDDAALYGPAELADLLGISVANVHQRRHRGLLPPADLTLSRVPIWTGETIRLWQEWTVAS